MIDRAIAGPLHAFAYNELVFRYHVVWWRLHHLLFFTEYATQWHTALPHAVCLRGTAKSTASLTTRVLHSLDQDRHGLRGIGRAELENHGMGTAGVVLGSVFGLVSMSKHKQSDDHCDGAGCGDQTGIDLRDSARSAGNVQATDRHTRPWSHIKKRPCSVELACSRHRRLHAAARWSTPARSPDWLR